MPAATWRPRSLGWKPAVVVLVLAAAAEPAVALQAADPWPPPGSGLVFVWENGGASNTIPSGDGLARLCRLVPSGQASFDRFWAMQLEGGGFHAEAAMNGDLLARWRTSGRLTLAMVVTPGAGADADVTTIAAFGDTADSWNFALAQRGDALMLGIAGAPPGPQLVDVARLAAGRPHHVVVTVEATETLVYVDGRRVWSRAGEAADLAAWTGGQLTFGQSADGNADWTGRIEHVALFDRALGGEEVAAHFAASERRRGDRRPLPLLVVDARLAAKRDIPRATVYPNSLVVFDYSVLGVIQGSYADQKILVVHRGNLNGRRQQTTQDLRVGRSYRLRLEPFDRHPELAALQLVANDDDLHLPLFFAVAEPEPAGR